MSDGHNLARASRCLPEANSGRNRLRRLRVPGAGLEPARPLGAADFKSAASTDFAIRAGERKASGLAHSYPLRVSSFPTFQPPTEEPV